MRASDRDIAVAFVLTELGAIEARLTEAIANCRDWAQDGYPATSVPGVGHNTSVNDPVGRMAVQHQVDQYRAEAREADQHIRTMVHTTRWLVAFVNRNTQRKAGIYCGNVNCDRVMTGIDNDRPRGPARLCPRCYIHERRHAQPWPHRLASARNPVTQD